MSHWLAWKQHQHAHKIFITYFPSPAYCVTLTPQLELQHCFSVQHLSILECEWMNGSTSMFLSWPWSFNNNKSVFDKYSISLQYWDSWLMWPHSRTINKLHTTPSGVIKGFIHLSYNAGALLNPWKQRMCKISEVEKSCTDSSTLSSLLPLDTWPLAGSNNKTWLESDNQ